MKKTLIILAAILTTATLLTACTKNVANTVDTTEKNSTINQTENTANKTVTNDYTEPKATENETTTKPEYTEPKTNSNDKNTESPKATEPKTNTVNITITKEEAKAATLKHAGLKETDVKQVKIELDKERNGLVYEIDFDAGKYEYEYEINAENGKIIKAEKEIKD